CHGSNGQGDKKRFFPRLHGQHYAYLLRQLRWIRDGKRRNANPEMARRLGKLKENDLVILADYISRIKPPAEDVAPVGWKNPDFK
ncbi:MAG TPA: cytochrome C, partial [Gammaproteobacteria bacterium]|nr:cytochrome C [Gammaproteobacteria bacterium]